MDRRISDGYALTLPGGEMRLEHALDLGGADPPLEPRDGPAILDEDEGRYLPDRELRDPIRRGVSVYAGDAQAPTLRARKMGEQALHAPRGP